MHVAFIVNVEIVYLKRQKELETRYDTIVCAICTEPDGQPAASLVYQKQEIDTTKLKAKHDEKRNRKKTL